MNTRTIFIILLISFACNHDKIILEKVSFLPDYFSSSKHFGKDIKSIDELNEFILVTGKIDTTSETPPLKLAIISVDNTKIFMHLDKTTSNNEEVREIYSGNGYALSLIYREKKESSHGLIYEGHLIIEHNSVKTEYNVVGTPGYY